MPVKRVGLVGGGVIGAGWAARFSLCGIDVSIYDPDPELPRKLDAVLANARHSWSRLFPDRAASERSIHVAGSVAEAVAGAEFIQESLPEREDIKRRVLAEIEAAAPPDIVIGSSTSGLLPSRLQEGMKYPERLVVGHPFNPVYLLPLVEVCGGARTSDATAEHAASLYRSIGMHPLLVRREIDGFIADRLLEALWREALWLVNDGIATTAEIDDAIRFGAGLRWSFMGTFLIYRVAGGEAGMRHFLAQFGPALKLPWTRLEAPELTKALIDRISSQSDDQAAGTSIRALERQRDDCLVEILDALRRQDYGAGATLRAWQEASRLTTAQAPLLALHGARVLPEWIDYNGHMTECRYSQVFGDATDALLTACGCAGAYLKAQGSFFTTETHATFQAEARLGDELDVETQILGFDGKRLHVFHRLLRGAARDSIATSEQMLLHVMASTRRAGPAGGDAAAWLHNQATAHAVIARPREAQRSVGAPRN